MAYKKLICDGDFRGDLTATFARDTAAPFLSGVEAAANVPRFGRPVDVPACRPWSRQLAVAQGQIFLGSGYDHDGVTELAIYINTATLVISIFRNNDFSTPVLTHATLRNGRSDVLVGTALEDAGYEYSPSCGVVCHGAIYMLCRRREVVAGNTENVAVVMMQATSSSATDWWDAGQISIVGNLQKLGNVGTYDGQNRIERWAMANYWPDSDNPVLTGAWFPFVDYMIASGTGDVGGQVGLFHASRTAVGAQWTAGAMKLVDDTVETDGARAQTYHAHSAWTIVRSTQKLEVIAHFGDGSENNVTYRYVMDDTVGGDIITNYATVTPSRSVVYASQTDTNYGKADPQIAGVCPSPRWGRAISGGDETYSGLYEIEVPESLSLPAIYRPLYHSTKSGNGDGVASNTLSLWVHCAAPERKTGYTAAYNAGTSSSGGKQVSDADLREAHSLVLYSQDGVYWSSVGHIPQGGGMSGSSTNFMAGSKAVGLFEEGTTVDGIYLALKPSVIKRISPLMLRRGGSQYGHRESAYTLAVVNTDATNEAAARWLTLDANDKWVDQGSTLEHQPPCGKFCGGVRYMEVVDEAAPSRNLGTYGVANRHAFNDIVPENGKTGMVVWVMLAPGSDAGVLLRVRFNDGANLGVTTNAKIYSYEQWVPIVIYDDPRDGTPGSGVYNAQIQLEATATTGTSCKFYVAFGPLLVDEEYPGYPIEYGIVDASASAEAAVSDETLEVTGFTCGSDWTVAVTMRIPEDSWDTASGIHATTGLAISTQHLFCIFGNASNFVDVTAKLDGVTMSVKKLIASGQIAGVPFTDIELTGVWYNRGDILKVIVSQETGLPNQIEFSCQVAGPGMHATTNMEVINTSGTTAAWSTNTPTKVKFTNNDDTLSAQIDVISVVVDEDNWTDVLTHRTLIKNNDELLHYDAPVVSNWSRATSRRRPRTHGFRG